MSSGLYEVHEVIVTACEDFFRQYITPQSAIWYPPDAQCTEDPDSCTDDVRRGFSAVTFRFQIPEVSWLDGMIQCNVNADGRVSSVVGVPDCVKDRGECVFPYDQAAAEAIAARAGLEVGIEAWAYHCHWHDGFHTYVWIVCNTLSRHRFDGEGRGVAIDANDGRVLETFWWNEMS